MPAAFATGKDRPGRGRGERARDDGDPPVEPQDGLRQQPQAPVHRGTEAPLAGRGSTFLGPGVGARLGSGVRDTLRQLVHELVRGKHAEGGCRELDRQGDPVEAPADRGDERHVRGRGLQLRARRERPLEEQRGSRVRTERRLVLLAIGRDRQGLDPHDPLLRHTEGEPAGGEDRQSGRAGLQVRERRGGRADVLDGVEDEQCRPATELRGEGAAQGLGQGAPGLVGDADGTCDRGEHQRRIADAVERHDRDTSVPCPEVTRCQLRREAALADPAHADQGDEAGLPASDEPSDLLDRGVSPDKGRRGALRGRRRPAWVNVGRGVNGRGMRRSVLVSRRVHQGPEHTPSRRTRRVRARVAAAGGSGIPRPCRSA